MEPLQPNLSAHEFPAAVRYLHPESPPPAVDEALHLPPRASRTLGATSKGLAIVAGAAIMLLMLATVADVVFRKAGGGGIAGVVEWTEVLLVLVVYAGMMGAELSGAHIRGMSFLTQRQHSVVAPAVRCIGSALAAMLLTWAVYATGQDAVMSVQMGEFRMGLIQVPIWPAKLAIPVGLAGFAAVLFYRCVDQLRQALREARRRHASAVAGVPTKASHGR